MAGEKGKSREAVVNRICEFLVVATHAILYIHHVYPQRIFVMRNKYGVATFFSRHPDINDYIARTVSNMRSFLLDDMIQSVAIVVSHDGQVLARYLYEMSVLANEEDITAASLGDIDNQLRAHLCRLLSVEAPDPQRDRAREVVKDETTFEYVLHTKGVHTGEAWMPADGEERREFKQQFEVLPLKDADRFSSVLQMSSRMEVPPDQQPT